MFVINKLPKAISAEAYRSLRTNIKYSAIDNDIKTIVITSSIPGEGKSTVAGNLAFSFSDAGYKVLIIDCDLRKPSLHRKFGISNNFGLTDLLIEKTAVKEGIKQISKNLSIITSGSIPPNPSEILGSNAFSNLIEIVKQSFDYILIDTPPLIPVTDAQILSKAADGTILVVRSGKTKAKILMQGYEKLKEVNAYVIGSVLNDTNISNKDSYYYYYEEDKKRKRKLRWKISLL